MNPRDPYSFAAMHFVQAIETAINERYGTCEDLQKENSQDKGV